MPVYDCLFSSVQVSLTEATIFIDSSDPSLVGKNCYFKTKLFSLGWGSKFVGALYLDKFKSHHVCFGGSTAALQ